MDKNNHKPSPKSPFLYIGGFWTIPKWLVYIGLRHCFTHITSNFCKNLSQLPDRFSQGATTLWSKLGTSLCGHKHWELVRDSERFKPCGLKTWKADDSAREGKKLEKCCFNYGKMLRNGDLTWFNHEKWGLNQLIIVFWCVRKWGIPAYGIAQRLLCNRQSDDKQVGWRVPYCQTNRFFGECVTNSQKGRTSKHS